MSLASLLGGTSSHFEQTSHPCIPLPVYSKTKTDGSLNWQESFGPSQILEKSNTHQGTPIFELIFTTLPSPILKVKIHLALCNLKAFYFIATENPGTIFYFDSKNATYIYHASRTKNQLAWERLIPQQCFNGNIPLHFFKFTKHIHSIYSVLAALITF